MKKAVLIVVIVACVSGLSWWLFAYYSGGAARSGMQVKDTAASGIPRVPANTHPTHKVENVKK